MFLNQKYRLRKFTFSGHDFYQVQCFKDWSDDPRDNNKWIGVSQLLRGAEDTARQFLLLLEDTQRARAANYTVRQEK